ncbi:hypothetical protein DRO54_10520 [Candidatus Bathyarchaeota archaeon]|nr:MAG: hypothetical protein DRO54_10520 [Candidatus Bathyarchaeota archaeon]
MQSSYTPQSHYAPQRQDDLRAKALAMYCNGSSLAEIARVLRVPRSELLTWKENFSWDRVKAESSTEVRREAMEQYRRTALQRRQIIDQAWLELAGEVQETIAELRSEEIDPCKKAKALADLGLALVRAQEAERKLLEVVSESSEAAGKAGSAELMLSDEALKQEIEHTLGLFQDLKEAS